MSRQAHSPLRTLQPVIVRFPIISEVDNFIYFTAVFIWRSNLL